jgi:hypothetical protein
MNLPPSRLRVAALLPWGRKGWLLVIALAENNALLICWRPMIGSCDPIGVVAGKGRQDGRGMQADKETKPQIERALMPMRAQKWVSKTLMWRGGHAAACHSLLRVCSAVGRREGSEAGLSACGKYATQKCLWEACKCTPDETELTKGAMPKQRGLSPRARSTISKGKVRFPRRVFRAAPPTGRLLTATTGISTQRGA